MYKLYTMFDTKSVKITHFHLFIKEIILLFTSVQNISQNFDTRVLHFAQRISKFIKKNLNFTRLSIFFWNRNRNYKTKNMKMNQYTLFYKNPNLQIIPLLRKLYHFSNLLSLRYIRIHIVQNMRTNNVITYNFSLLVFVKKKKKEKKIEWFVITILIQVHRFIRCSFWRAHT